MTHLEPTRLRPNVDHRDLYLWIVRDFETAWNAVAALPEGKDQGRGNVMFGRQAMGLLEWAVRVAQSDSSGRALNDFARSLAEAEPRYFTVLPGACVPEGGELVLPSLPGSEPGTQLLSAMFDLIRHGGAHQYQQITVDLGDGHWVMSLTGAAPEMTLERALSERARDQSHLGFGRAGDTVFMVVRPEMLLLDFKRAIDHSGLLRRGDLGFKHLGRPRNARQRLYSFNTEALSGALRGGGHVRVGIRGVTDAV